MKAAHTPGPWSLGAIEFERGEAGEHICINAPTHGGIAMVVWKMEDARIDGVRSPECEANTHLIATSPELFSELIDFHDHAIDQGWHDCDGIPGGCPVMNVLIKATRKT